MRYWKKRISNSLRTIKHQQWVKVERDFNSLRIIGGGRGGGGHIRLTLSHKSSNSVKGGGPTNKTKITFTDLKKKKKLE